MIPSSNVAEVERWLKVFPNVEVVSRDSAQIYASAVNGVYPLACQVSDRFHIIKAYPARIEIQVVTVQGEEMKQLLSISNRRKRIVFAHEQNKYWV